MWTRAQLKEKGKKAFKLNYWKTVLIAIIAIGLLGTTGAGSGFTLRFRGNDFFNNNNNNSISYYTEEQAESAIAQLDNMLDQIDDLDDINSIPSIINSLDSDSQDIIGKAFSLTTTFGLLTLVLSAVFIAMIVAALAIVISVFLFGPLAGGASRFFVKNLGSRAEVKELAFNYDHGYLNAVKTIFLKRLYTFLWSLLLIIPGIVKAYEYRMIPYILAENPDMPCNEIFARSKELMTGQKWRAFVLDLSFLGWEILSALTLGILGVFYVNPYRLMTNAALYEALAYGTNNELAV
ncbi:MAG: DUF975 family protein [Lachnospiraceae bacterium]|nr:DUF975 family protein [Lachnospiraceae bacterium]